MIPGEGVTAMVNSKQVRAGNLNLIKDTPVSHALAVEVEQYLLDGCTVVYVAIEHSLAGYLVLTDTIRQESPQMIRAIYGLGMQPVLLTGDHQNAAEVIGGQLGIKEIHANCLPEDKLSQIEAFQKLGNDVCMIGDGINDAPVLMRSDIGIAMGALGSDAAIEAADVVIVDDNLSKIYMSMCIAKKTMSIVKQNIIFSIGIKVLFLILGTFGLMTMWGAIFADVGVTLIAVLNSLRTLNSKNYIK